MSQFVAMDAFALTSCAVMRSQWARFTSTHRPRPTRAWTRSSRPWRRVSTPPPPRIMPVVLTCEQKCWTAKDPRTRPALARSRSWSSWTPLNPYPPSRADAVRLTHPSCPLALGPYYARSDFCPLPSLSFVHNLPRPQLFSVIPVLAMRWAASAVMMVRHYFQPYLPSSGRSAPCGCPACRRPAARPTWSRSA